MKSFLKTVYAFYTDNPEGWLRILHRKCIKSPLLTKILFSTQKLPPLEGPAVYFDLTTVLLKYEVKKFLKKSTASKILELGVGRYAVLSGFFSRFTNQTIDAADINPKFITTARKVIESNHLNINAMQSDGFSNVPLKTYDFIFWNLPYYAGPVFLDGLFGQSPEYMSPDSKLIIGYNSVPLPYSTICQFLNKYPDLYLEKQITYSWNLHQVLIIQKAQKKSNRIHQIHL